MKLRPEPAIYVFTNMLNGKKYVGETLNMQQRIRSYKWEKANRPFTSALRKYGWEGFDVQITYYPYADKVFLVNIEYLLIKAYNCLAINGKGYNVCEMGADKTNFKYSAESKIKMSESHKGKKFSAETRSKMSKVKNKPVAQYTKSGILVAVFPSAKEAEKITGINNSRISQNCLGKANSAKGFKWRFAQNN